MIRLFIVNGSHPCAAAERALQLKGLEYRVRELPPPLHMPAQRLLFGARTVPAMKLDGGEKVSGSSAILRRLDELVPEPPLFPADPAARAEVEEAERWGDEVFQPIARRLLWPAFARHPAAMAGYQQGSRLPALPKPVLIALAPVVTRVEMRANHASQEAVAGELAALPGHLDRIDAWIEAGVLGGEQPNAADLQIGATSRLLLTIGDVRPAFAGRPAEAHALRTFPTLSGSVPEGVLTGAG